MPIEHTSPTVSTNFGHQADLHSANLLGSVENCYIVANCSGHCSSMKRISLITLVLLGLAFFARAVPLQGWTEDYGKAVEKAKAENKNLLLAFTGSDWCGYCMALDKEVFSTEKFKTWAHENLVLVQVDFPRQQQSLKVKQQNSELKSRYPTNGFPTILIVDADGNQLAREVGYHPGTGPDAYVAALESRLGLQQQRIAVSTGNPEESSIQPALRASIPELIRIEPRGIVWPLNGENTPRTVRITTGTDQPVRILRVRTSDDRIFAQLKQIEPGRVYEINVLTSSTLEALRGMVRIETDYPPGRPKTFNLTVEIEAPFNRQNPAARSPQPGNPASASQSIPSSPPAANRPAATMPHLTINPSAPTQAGVAPSPAGVAGRPSVTELAPQPQSTAAPSQPNPSNLPPAPQR